MAFGSPNPRCHVQSYPEETELLISALPPSVSEEPQQQQQQVSDMARLL